MRTDRQDTQSRPISFELDYIPHAPGSVLARFGSTAVLCNVCIEETVPKHLIGTQKGWITAEYAMLPQAGLRRSPRDGRPTVKGRVHEIQRLIGRSLRAGLDLNVLGPRTITVDCDVLCADGGTRTASITGGWIALRMAVWRFFDHRVPPGLISAECLAAISAGWVDGRCLLDLDYHEDSAADVDLNLVGTDQGGWIEIQGTSESKPQHASVFQDLIRLAAEGLPSLFAKQREIFERGRIG